jgi:hypothetical protein
MSRDLENHPRSAIFGCLAADALCRNMVMWTSLSPGLLMGFFWVMHYILILIVLNLETNHIMETCEVTFDETTPYPSSVFEPAGPDQMGQTIFVEEHDNADWVALETPPATPVEPASTTTADGPDPTPSTTWGPLEPAPAETGGVEAAVEGRPLLQGRLHIIFNAVTHLRK